jgi:diguanylate cyclase (GGDEF)-like protein
MASALSTHHDPVGGTDIAHTLARARRAYYEDPAGALVDAIRCHEIARSREDESLCARARALQGAVSLHRGDLRGALELVVEAERHSEGSGEAAARAEVAALKAQLSFFTGSYAEALANAELAVALADEGRDEDLRIYARRATCLVFGNVGVPDLLGRITELLQMTIEAGDRWEETISRNDLACYFQMQGDLAAAEREIDRALEVAHGMTSPNSFALGIVHSTRADIGLLAGRARDALRDAERAITLLTTGGMPNPYVLGVTIRAEVQALMDLGELDNAQQSGESALAWLGDHVPQTRSLILSTLATALREAGRLEDAYDALARSAELERQAYRELSELQLGLERATLEARAARALQEQLREQAERDWLTGLHNRRYLARELDRLGEERLAGPVSLAVLDLDHFKSINDRFGHHAGDQVLVRVARLLCDVLRASDIVVRSGGEEFIVLMPATDARAAAACCERIREAIRDESWDQIAPERTVTASIGVASTQYPDDLEALVRLADRRLYDAKHSGRDRVIS